MRQYYLIHCADMAPGNTSTAGTSDAHSLFQCIELSRGPEEDVRASCALQVHQRTAGWAAGAERRGYARRPACDRAWTLAGIAPAPAYTIAASKSRRCRPRNRFMMCSPLIVRLPIALIGGALLLTYLSASVRRGTGGHRLSWTGCWTTRPRDSWAARLSARAAPDRLIAAGVGPFPAVALAGLGDAASSTNRFVDATLTILEDADWIGASHSGLRPSGRSRPRPTSGSARRPTGKVAGRRVASPFDNAVPEARQSRRDPQLARSWSERPHLIMSYWRGADSAGHDRRSDGSWRCLPADAGSNRCSARVARADCGLDALLLVSDRHERVGGSTISMRSSTHQAHGEYAASRPVVRCSSMTQIAPPKVPGRWMPSLPFAPMRARFPRMGSPSAHRRHRRHRRAPSVIAQCRGTVALQGVTRVLRHLQHARLGSGLPEMGAY
jgi:hypothetical protein